MDPHTLIVVIPIVVLILILALVILHGLGILEKIEDWIVENPYTVLALIIVALVVVVYFLLTYPTWVGLG